MRAPLEDKAAVPESEDGEQGNRADEGSALGAEKTGCATEENRETENKKRSERNEKAIAVRRDASPVRVTSDEEVKGEEGSEKRGAATRFALPEEEESRDGEKKNGRPGEETVIGREKHLKKVWGK